MKTHYRTAHCLALSVIVVVTVSTRAQADFTFGEPTNLGPTVNSPSLDGTPNISADGLKMYFQSTRPGGLGYEDLWVSTRQSASEPWGSPVNLTTVNSAYREAFPSVSADGLELYFSDYYYGPDRPGGQGGQDLWMTSRTSLNDPWDTPINLGPVINSSAQEVSVSISNDTLVMIFASNRAGGRGSGDLYRSTRLTAEDSWGIPVNMGPTVNTSSFDAEACFSADGLSLIFCSERPGGFGSYDLWMTTRKSRNGSWQPPVNLGASLNTSSSDGAPALSHDMKTLYFASSRPGGYGNDDIYEASILPVVDFNGDGIVDATDMCIMVDHWGMDDPSCDIGPMPWGDGIIDVEDLKVLAEHLFEEVNDPTLIAHWRLDEVQGVTAYDSAAGFDGTLIGGPIWQPEGGMLLGAIQLDGIDDYVSTDPVLDPSKGAFSVVAWVNGGAPGQAVFSQIARADWLLTDSVEGCLMTNLTASGRGSSGPLRSETIISDGNWHRIGLVWDGSYRRLYVDGAEVVRDAASLSSLESTYGGLYFGVGKIRTTGTFFSGLIDDVRIYNRAVKP
jgi:hypothetical protein